MIKHLVYKICPLTEVSHSFLPACLCQLCPGGTTMKSGSVGDGSDVGDCTGHLVHEVAIFIWCLEFCIPYTQGCACACLQSPQCLSSLGGSTSVNQEHTSDPVEVWWALSPLSAEKRMEQVLDGKQLGARDRSWMSKTLPLAHLALESSRVFL